MDATQLTNDFLIKSLAELIDEESNRILGAKLLSINRLKEYITSSLKDSKDMFKSLSHLHTKLASIKLPEDVKSIPEENKKEEKEMEKELEKFIKDEEDEEIKEMAHIIADTLSKIAAYVGERGNHEAAYLIERYIHTLDQE